MTVAVRAQRLRPHVFKSYQSKLHTHDSRLRTRNHMGQYCLDRNHIRQNQLVWVFALIRQIRTREDDKDRDLRSHRASRDRESTKILTRRTITLSVRSGECRWDGPGSYVHEAENVEPSLEWIFRVLGKSFRNTELDRLSWHGATTGLFYC